MRRIKNMIQWQRMTYMTNTSSGKFVTISCLKFEYPSYHHSFEYSQDCHMRKSIYHIEVLGDLLDKLCAENADWITCCIISGVKVEVGCISMTLAMLVSRGTLSCSRISSVVSVLRSLSTFWNYMPLFLTIIADLMLALGCDVPIFLATLALNFAHIIYFGLRNICNIKGGHRNYSSFFS